VIGWTARAAVSVGPLTDGLLVLRYLFGFRGATLVSGAFDVVGCTRCNAPAMEAYLGGLVRGRPRSPCG
jgi:hypothetical protein